jgi:ATP-binding cassette subfamily F protein 3
MLVEVEGVSKRFGGLRALDDVSLIAHTGEVTAVIGPNGAGKSTLLKLLAGVNQPQAGTREPGHNVKVGYFAQHRVEMLNAKQTVLETVQDMEQPVPEVTARSILGSFLFRGDDVFKPVAVLSGGEKSRLALVKLLLDPPNLLLMDEPTTHLDIGSIDALIHALTQYEGTLIFISHDVHFIRAIARTVLHISAGRLTPYAGDYDYYLDKSRAGSAREALTAGEKLADFRPTAAAVAAAAPRSGPGMREQKEQKRAESAARNERAKARREREKRVESLEMEIVAWETRQKTVAAELESPTAYDTGGKAIALNRELIAIGEELARLNTEWEKAAAEVTAAEA